MVLKKNNITDTKYATFTMRRTMPLMSVCVSLCYENKSTNVNVCTWFCTGRPGQSILDLKTTAPRPGETTTIQLCFDCGGGNSRGRPYRWKSLDTSSMIVCVMRRRRICLCKYKSTSFYFPLYASGEVANKLRLYCPERSLN